LAVWIEIGDGAIDDLLGFVERLEFRSQFPNFLELLAKEI